MEKLGTGRRENQSASGARKQLSPDVLFEQSNLMTDRRGRDVEFLRGQPDIASSANGFENP
ncbi:MAG TPA: hypothetical protein VHL34_07310 [Rhizomicrobium sp.]|nr:hypothetical protein [Rhizomicrobium sp.]